MAAVKFFVEGKRDVRFVTDYVKHLFNKELLQTDFIKINGCTEQLIELRINDFKASTDLGATNLLLFDANGDYKEKVKQLLLLKSKLNIAFELFLFPNDKDAGNLETLLENIALKEHRVIFDCFDKYQECVKGSNSNYTLPNQKARIYAYVEALLPRSQSEKIKDENRDYLNTLHWDLNAEYLEALKKFLERYYT